MKRVKIVLASVCLALCTFFLVACGGIEGIYESVDSVSVGGFQTEATYILEIKNDGTFTYTVKTSNSSTSTNGKWTKDEENENVYRLEASGILGNGTLEVKDKETVVFNGREYKK